eukprot:832062-Prymnesium_polylepis.1
MRLVSQAHKAEDAEALMHAQLADARDQQLRRRRAILERAPELASQAGLRPDGVRKFRASLEALDVQLEAEARGQSVQHPRARSGARLPACMARHRPERSPGACAFGVLRAQNALPLHAAPSVATFPRVRAGLGPGRSHSGSCRCALSPHGRGASPPETCRRLTRRRASPSPHPPTADPRPPPAATAAKKTQIW